MNENAETVNVETNAETEVTTEPAGEVVESAAESTNEGTSLRELNKLKAQLSKANSEAANYKRQLRERMSAEEAAQAERNEQFQSMQTELEELRRSRTLTDYRGRFVELGLSGEAADLAAEALADGRTDDLFSGLQTFLASVKKSAVADAMNSQGGLSTGEPVNANDAEKRYDEMLRKAAGLI